MILLVIASLEAIVFGASALFEGYYSFSTWGSLTIAAIALTMGMLFVSPLRLTRPGRVALLALGGLLAWSALSMLWAPSTSRAWLEVNRVGFYVVILVLTLIVIRSASQARVVVALVGAASSLVTAYVLARMLLGSGSELFVQGRLSEPLGYINGEAGFLLMGFWCALAMAVGRGRPALRAVAMAATVACIQLLVLTQSRAIVPALLISIFAVMLCTPRRVATGSALLLVGAASAVALPLLLDVYSLYRDSASVPDDILRGRALLVTGVSGLAGVLWAVITRMRERPLAHRWRPRVRAALVATPLVALVAMLVAVGNPVTEARQQFDTFTSLKDTRGGSERFTDAGGFRYDLWRISWLQFRERPVLGVGAGNYVRTYFRERQNQQSVRQPHSIEMQMLGELGLPGLLLLLGFVGSVYWAAARRRALARQDPLLIVAALGAFTTWFVHTSVDWLWNLPGLTGLALLMAGILLGRSEPLSPQEPVAMAADGARERRILGARISMRFGPTIGLAAGVVALALLAASVGRLYLATDYRNQAYASVREGQSVAAVRNANKAISLNPDDLDAYYAKSAALARLGSYETAREALLSAASRVPYEYVPWALLGDLATRAGDRAAAQRYYRRGLSLNPNDSTLLSETAQNP